MCAAALMLAATASGAQDIPLPRSWEAREERVPHRFLHRLRPAGQGRLRVHAAVRLLQLPGHGLERQRFRERDDARAALGTQLRRGRALPRHLGPLRELRLHRAADLRISTTGLSLGTTGEWRMGHGMALQGTALLGTGYAAAGTVRSRDTNDFHYGVAPAGPARAALDHRHSRGDRRRGRVLREPARRARGAGTRTSPPPSRGASRAPTRSPSSISATGAIPATPTSAASASSARPSASSTPTSATTASATPPGNNDPFI